MPEDSEQSSYIGFESFVFEVGEGVSGMDVVSLRGSSCLSNRAGIRGTLGVEHLDGVDGELHIVLVDG